MTDLPHMAPKCGCGWPSAEYGGVVFSVNGIRCQYKALGGSNSLLSIPKTPLIWESR